MRRQNAEGRMQNGRSTSPRPSPQSGEGGGDRAAKTDLRVVRCAGRVAGAETLKAEIGEEEKFLTRRELAGLLKVSVRTVDEMVAAKEITPVRIRGLVRFYLPDVVRELTAAAVERLQRLKEEA